MKSLAQLFKLFFFENLLDLNCSINNYQNPNLGKVQTTRKPFDFDALIHTKKTHDGGAKHGGHEENADLLGEENLALLEKTDSIKKKAK